MYTEHHKWSSQLKCAAYTINIITALWLWLPGCGCQLGGAMGVWMGVLRGICGMGARGHGLPNACVPGLGAHMPGRPPVPMLQILKCNTLAPRIRGIQGAAYLMLPWFGGNIFDVTQCCPPLALWRLCWRLYIYNRGWRFRSWVLLITAIERINI